jgi:hypothetical protein
MLTCKASFPVSLTTIFIPLQTYKKFTYPKEINSFIVFLQLFLGVLILFCSLK